MLTGYASVVASGFMIGVGGSAGAAGPLALVSYWVFGGLATFATAFCYSELATMFPKCGGIWEYTKQAIGEDHPVSFMVGWIYWFALLFGLNVELVSVGIYLHVLVPSIPEWVGAVTTAIIFLTFNIIGVRLSTLVQAGFGVILISSFFLFIGVGSFQLDLANYANFAPNGVVMPMLKTLPFVVIAFCGFDVAVTLAEESKNPERDIPKALITAAAFLTVLFGGFATVLLGLLPNPQNLTTDAPLIQAGGILFGTIGIIWLAIQSFTGSLSTVNGGVIGQTRIMFALAREGWLPRVFSKVDEKRKVPKNSIYFTGLSMIIVSFLPLITDKAWQWAGFLGVFGYALTYIAAALLVMYLRVKRPDIKRPFRTPLVPLIPIIGILLYLLAVLFSGMGTILVGVIWCLVGVAYYYIFARNTRENFKLENRI